MHVQEVIHTAASHRKKTIQRLILRSPKELPRESTYSRGKAAVRVAWSNMRRAPLTTFLTLSIMSVVIALASLLLLVIENVDKSLKAKTSSLTMSFFLAGDYTPQDSDRLLSLLTSRNEIDSARFVRKDEALERLRHELGINPLVIDGTLKSNPLPDSIEATLKRNYAGVIHFETLKTLTEELPGLDMVLYDKSSVIGLSKGVQSMRMFFMLLIPAFFMLSGFVMWITITLGLFSYRKEIEVMKLLGASESFILMPCLLEGAIIGSIGSLFGLGTIESLRLLLLSTLAHDPFLSLTFGAHTHSMSDLGYIFIFCTATCVGIAGSFLAVKGFLARLS